MTSAQTDLSTGQLARLTTAKTVSNGAARWMLFFLPTLAVAFSTTIPRLTLVAGFAEAAGLATLLLVSRLDRPLPENGRSAEIVTIVGALALTTIAAVIALSGRFVLLAIGFPLTMLGVALTSVAGHTYLSRRVRFDRRARVLGIFETSWALSLLVGAPAAAALITVFGWRGPFVAVIAAASVVAAIIWTSRDDSVLLPDAQGPGAAGAATVAAGLGRDAWMAIAASGFIAVAGLATIAITGTWLNDALGVSTGGIGLVAIAFGFAELMASASSAGFADRIGPTRATLIASVLLIAGLVAITQTGKSLVVGTIALFVFFVGFEFAVVTSFSIVSEAVPAARGRVLATNTAVGTVMRGLGVAASGTLYERSGVAGPAALSVVAAAVAVVLLVAIQRTGR